MTPRVRMGDVLQLQRRSVAVDPSSEYEEIGLRSFGKGIFHKEPVTGVELGNKRVFRIEPGDLVLSNVFAWEGAVAVATSDEAGKIGSHRFMTFTPKDHRIDARWVAWFLLSESGLELLGKASPGSAGRNRTLAIERFGNLEIPLVPMEEQQRVAALLGRVDAQVFQMMSLAQRSTDISRALRGAVASSKGPPTPLADLVAPVRRPVTLDPARPYRMLGCRWYGEGLFVRETKTGAETAASTLYSVESGDLVYNRLFAWKGSFALADDESAGALVSGEFPTFRIDLERAVPEYLLAAMESPAFIDAVDRRSAGGTPTSRNRLKENQFIQIAIPTPDLAEQRQIAARTKVINEVNARRRRLLALAEAVMPASLNDAFPSVN